MECMLTVHKARGLASDRAETAGRYNVTLATIEAREPTPSAGTPRPAAGTAPRLLHKAHSRVVVKPRGLAFMGHARRPKMKLAHEHSIIFTTPTACCVLRWRSNTFDPQLL